MLSQSQRTTILELQAKGRNKREIAKLLHLSRQCNDPALVADLHAGADYALTIAGQFSPTRWIRLARAEKPLAKPVVTARAGYTPSLWAAQES